MNNTLKIIILVLLSFLINIVQSTLISPNFNSYFYPDLNLIFIILIAISKDTPGFFIALLNGYIMDVMSGYMIGVHSLSRLSLYVILRSSSNQIDYENYTPKVLALFLGTIFVWIFIWIILKSKFSNDFKMTLNVILNQATINTFLGIITVFYLNKIYAAIQK